MDKLVQAILKGKLHLLSCRQLKAMRKNTERAGKNLEALLKKGGDK